MNINGGYALEAKEFIDLTVNKLDDDKFLALKERLLGEYLTFFFIDEKKISKAVFSEKLIDYFEKLEIKTKEEFENTLQTYMGNWDALVSKRIAKTPSVKKNEPPAPVPRARKYYEKIQEIKKSRNLTLRQIVDYTRIVMCLYSSIVEANHSEISDFGYPTKCLEIDRMIASMKEEKSTSIPIGTLKKKTMFDLADLYCSDTGTFIITMIIYYHIKNNEIEGEY